METKQVIEKTATDQRIDKVMQRIIASIADGSSSPLAHEAKLFMLEFCAMGVTPNYALEAWLQIRLNKSLANPAVEPAWFEQIPPT